MTSVCIVGGDHLIEQMYLSRGWGISATVDEADLIQFTGGADVTPNLYGEENVRSYCDTSRDIFERKIFDHAYRIGKNMVGICRGGQFLNVMNGGKMWQHVDGHTNTHYVSDKSTGIIARCTSTHHQMMRPASHGEVVAVAAMPISTVFVGGDGEFGRDIQDDDIEVVWYKDTNCLCFQPHPEYGVTSCEDYFFRLLERYFG